MSPLSIVRGNLDGGGRGDGEGGREGGREDVERGGRGEMWREAVRVNNEATCGIVRRDKIVNVMHDGGKELFRNRFLNITNIKPPHTLHMYKYPHTDTRTSELKLVAW